MVKISFLDYGAGNIRSLRNALTKVMLLSTSPSPLHISLSFPPPTSLESLHLVLGNVPHAPLPGEAGCTRWLSSRGTLPGYSILPSIRASRCSEACSLTCACAGVGQVGCEIEDVKSADDIANARILIFPGGFLIRARGPTSANGLAMSLPAFLALQSETAWSILSSRARSSAAIRVQLIQPLSSSPPVLLLSSPTRPYCSGNIWQVSAASGCAWRISTSWVTRTLSDHTCKAGGLSSVSASACRCHSTHFSLLPSPPSQEMWPGLGNTWLGSFLP